MSRHFVVGSLLTCAGAMASTITLSPPGLAAGATYHLVFVTSLQVNGTLSQAGYNAAAQSAASAIPGGGAITWQALASTPSQAANGIPIGGGVYRLDGVPVAPGGFSDLWDGTLLNPININEQGNVQNGPVYTGSASDGSGFQTLGSPIVMTGQSNSPTSTWVMSLGAPQATLLPLYAISQPMVVGATQYNPVIPGAGGISIGANGAPTYTFTNTKGGFWHDPASFSIFDFDALPGTLFSTIELPLGFQNSFDVYKSDGLGGFSFLQTAAGGSTVNFGAGISEFRIQNIVPAVSGDNPAGFPVLINFSTATGSFQMTAISPEPSTFLLVGIGIALLGWKGVVTRDTRSQEQASHKGQFATIHDVW